MTGAEFLFIRGWIKGWNDVRARGRKDHEGIWCEHKSRYSCRLKLWIELCQRKFEHDTLWVINVVSDESSEVFLRWSKRIHDATTFEDYQFPWETNDKNVKDSESGSS